MADGNYKVGKDIQPGVYTASTRCLGTISSSPGYRSDGISNPDAFLGGSARVGNQQRIAVKAGQYFTSEQCPRGWKREGRTGPRTPDPATRVGACTILRGEDNLVRQTVDWLEAHSSATGADQDGGLIQSKLMAIVFSQTRGFWKLAGRLVDDLDAPKYFVGKDGKIDASVHATIRKIDALCAQ